MGLSVMQWRQCLQMPKGAKVANLVLFKHWFVPSFNGAESRSSNTGPDLAAESA
jgi:hypothetical protein